MSSVMHQWARFYAELGWAVFPLVPGTKSPFAGSQGSRDATTDLAQIDAWWSANPDANIGCKPSASAGGLYVFDVDPRNGGDKSFAELEAAHGAITSQLKVNSPGGGFHLYFSAPPGVRYTGAPASGIDGKYNGYVVLPPSSHPNGRLYEWDGGANPRDAQPAQIPIWLTRQDVERSTSNPARSGGLEDTERIRAALSTQDPDDYHQWIGAIAAVKHWEDTTEGAEGVGFDLVREWSSESPKHDDGAFGDKWESFDSSRPIARTLGSLLHDAGMTAAQRPLDVAKAFGTGTTAPTRPGLQEVPLDDVMTATLEPVRYAVKPWLPRRHVTLFGGHGGIGKSSLALAIGAHVACGQSFAGHEVERLPVLFVSLEDEPSIVRLRLRSIIEAYRLPAREVLEGQRLRLLDGTQAFAALLADPGLSVGKPIPTPAYHQLAEQARGAGLILIDNASDAFDANENSRRDVRAFIRSLADIARANNAAVVLLAHIDKVAAKQGAQNNSYSGSTAWHNSARSRLALIEQDGRHLLMHEKANLSSRADPLGISFRDGIPVPEVVSLAGGDRGAGDQEAILAALREAQAAGMDVPDNLHPGAHSVQNVLRVFPVFTDRFDRGNVGRQRVVAAITALKQSGRVRSEAYKSSHRKERTRLVPVLDELCTTGA